MELVEQLKAPATRKQALNKLLKCTSEQLCDPIPGLLDSLVDVDAKTKQVVLHLAKNGYCLRTLFLHEGVAKLVNCSFDATKGFSLPIMACFLENEENQKEALERFPKLIESMLNTRKHGASIVQIVVHLTQCDPSMFPSNPRLKNFAKQTLGEIELNILGLLAKLPGARPLLGKLPILMSALICHPGPVKLKSKALDVIANIVVEKQACVGFLNKSEDHLNALIHHECQYQAIAVIQAYCMNGVSQSSLHLVFKCAFWARTVQDINLRAAWMRLFRGPEGDYPIPMSLLNFSHLVQYGPFELMQDFRRVTREEFTTDYHLLQHGGEIRQRALQRLCQRATAWQTFKIDYAFRFSTPEHIQLLIQSWETHKNVNPNEPLIELDVIESISCFPEAAVPLSNIPGVMEMLLDNEGPSMSVEALKCQILVNFAANADFLASSKAVEAIPWMIYTLQEYGHFPLAKNQFMFIPLIYIASGRLREAYLCPGLVDMLLKEMLMRRDESLEALRLLEPLSCLEENQRDMRTRFGFVETMVAEYASNEPPVYDVDSYKEVLCTMLLRLAHNVELDFDDLSRPTLDQIVDDWRAVLAIWIMRSTRLVPRLRGSNLVRKLPVELARMVLQMLI